MDDEGVTNWMTNWSARAFCPFASVEVGTSARPILVVSGSSECRQASLAGDSTWAGPSPSTTTPYLYAVGSESFHRRRGIS